jgi:hypothetical protein
MSDAVCILALFEVCQRAEGADEPDCDHIGYSPFTIRKEICGSDGQTYSNEKHLEFENCLYRRGKENQSDFFRMRPKMYGVSERLAANSSRRTRLQGVDYFVTYLLT